MGQYQFFRIERGGGRSEAVSQSLPEAAQTDELPETAAEAAPGTKPLVH